MFAIRESRIENGSVVLKPQDVVVSAKLLGYKDFKPTVAELASALALSPSEVHGSIRRLQAARLVHSARLANAPILESIKEFFIHGFKYAFPPQRGELTRGMPTGYAAEPLKSLLVASDEPPPVWPYSDGSVRGVSFKPLYAKVPLAAKSDPLLYEILALLDAIRDGRVRERNLAERELLLRLGQPIG